ncbi:hypothetical protein CMQ_1647 [Grosmannia clavigera kw1407]|uniref:Uncharacterized protein n=1 Tax=Grosmannia clavigera (strain kw1407 / UAMH 11150) TaxID=655863 RepID=F0XED4_GROCL|nr:uncharacterized protein CMQ_1647 [Grosmannia clavigera kw1407]EFX04719.1 hypothetical protein CMQ_1647 [Grosmannia clavigera kw1407]
MAPSRIPAICLGLGLAICLVWFTVQLSLRSPHNLLAQATDLLGGLHDQTSALDETMSNGTDRPLVLYAYAESNAGRADLAFFVHNGLHRRADFVFIFNGPTNATDMVPADLPNVRVVQRKNTCFDLGAFGEVLRTDDLWKRYKRFITMNASIRGPFVPLYSSACWTDIFLNRVTERTKLVGLSLNCGPRPHVQSMIWATDSVGMAILLDPELAHSVGRTDSFANRKSPVGLTPCYSDWRAAVHAEIGTTELIQSQGYDVDVLMTAYQGHGGKHGKHGRKATKAYCDTLDEIADPFTLQGYFGSNIHPYETVFAKANRDIDLPLLEHLTLWHMNMNHTAWNMCGS